MEREIIIINEKEYAVLPIGKHEKMTHAIFANGEIHNGESDSDPLRGFCVYQPRETEHYECDKANLYGIKPLEFIARIPARVAYEMEGVARSINYGHGVGIYVPDEYCGRKFKLVEIID
jgi:hypothetical protein